MASPVFDLERYGSSKIYRYWVPRGSGHSKVTKFATYRKHNKFVQIIKSEVATERVTASR